MSGSSAGARPPPPCARPIPATDPWHRGVLRLLQLLLVASFAASGVAPSWAAGPVAVGSVAVGPGAMGPGAVDNRPQLVPRSATLPLRGSQHSGVALRPGLGPGLLGHGVRPALRPGPAVAWERAVKARHAILVDPATGAVLWGRRSRTSAAPASLTKMLTALTVRASLDLDTVTVASAEAARQPARRLAMKRGQALAVDQALKALMIVSANDVAVMLAETAGGSVARFARAIDAESERLGLRGSSWRNPNGLDARGHRSTAFDLAILARAVLEDRWPARVVERHHPTVPGSMAAAGLARAGATPGPRPVGSAARWSWEDRQRVATAAGAVAALLAAVAVAVHRFRQRT